MSDLHPLWSQLWPSDAPASLSQALAAHATTRSLRDGEWLFAKGDSANGLIGVQRGVIRSVHIGNDGRELLFGLFIAGSWFGEISLFDEAPRPLHAIAMGDTEVLVVPAAAFLTVLDAHPAGYRHFAKVLCRKLRVAFDQLEDMQQPLQQRLIKRLLDLASGYGIATPEGTLLSLHLSQEDLARMLGATRQSVNKELRALTTQGLLAVRAGRLLLPDARQLQSLLAAQQTNGAA